MDPDEITPPPLKQKRSALASEEAANIARAKLESIYVHEPDAKAEQAEVAKLHTPELSKHQKFMQSLTASGRDVAEIQTAWHEYYTGLNDQEKHEVWQEFYSTQSKLKQEEKAAQEAAAAAEAQAQATHLRHTAEQPQHHGNDHRTNTATHKRRTSLKKLSTQARTRHTPEHHQPMTASSAIQIKRMRRKHHIKAMSFGLGMGALVVFILLFSFFNERFISPFIRPSGNVSATPIIVDPNSTGPVGPESKIIIPKINVEVPVIYDVPTIEEKDVQTGLERGVVHYPTTANPGEIGNAVIFGHSSSNILNKGKYKFAFILLKSLEDEDTFIIQKDGKRYVYKVYSKFVTTPTDFSVLAASDKSIVTLITCDPPGTSTNRLIIQAEQIFPDPAGNKPSATSQGSAIVQPDQLPSNSVSLWQRIKNLF